MWDRDDFIRANFDHYRQSKHWYAQALTLRASAKLLEAAMRPELEKYAAALMAAQGRLDRAEDSTTDILSDEPNVMPMYLLHGYALENGLKAMLIDRDPTLLNTIPIKWASSGHDLCDLARKACLQLKNDEWAVLEWLAEVIVWKGRYSTPKRLSGFRTFWAFDHLQHDYSDTCLKTIDKVFQMLTDALPLDTVTGPTGFGALVRIDEDDL